MIQIMGGFICILGALTNLPGVKEGNTFSLAALVFGGVCALACFILGTISLIKYRE